MKMTSKPNVSLDARNELAELLKRKAEITVNFIYSLHPGLGIQII